MTPLEQLNTLLNQVENKLQKLNHENRANRDLRQENLEQFKRLYHQLEISEKYTNFTTLFNYHAMNLSGIGLRNEDFGEIRENKYVQIIVIAYTENGEGRRIAKNFSLGYFGKAEKVPLKLKNDIIEFVLRWRYEKTFEHMEHYQLLLSKLRN